MAFTTQLKAASNVPLAASEISQVQGNSPSGMKAIFAGPKGIRVGWRLLIFSVLVVVLLGSFLFIRNGGIEGFKEAYAHKGQIVVTPLLMGWSEGMAFLLICIATLIMGKIERRKFSEYGLPLNLAFKKDFWVGILFGFSGISGTLLVMFLLHGFRITGFALHGATLLSSGLSWGMAFVIVGLCEEFLNRGYFQHALASGIGFWPAALATSGFFALGHVFNANESLVGLVAVVLFGLLLSFFLLRSGTLWCAVGFHAAYDWGQTFYGVPDSGMVPYHSVFRSAFQGPRWLTGGVVGPEASVLTPIALLVVALVFSRFYRENRYEVSAT
jgi:membrane protease YdiL (CAAX protease family)